VALGACPCRRGIADHGAGADVPIGHASEESDLIQPIHTEDTSCGLVGL
jgi:hypothetical protein